MSGHLIISSLVHSDQAGFVKGCWATLTKQLQLRSNLVPFSLSTRIRLFTMWHGIILDSFNILALAVPFNVLHTLYSSPTEWVQTDHPFIPNENLCDVLYACKTCPLCNILSEICLVYVQIFELFSTVELPVLIIK